MPTRLETEAGRLDRTTANQLGDSFIFTPAGGKPRLAVGFIDPSETIGNPHMQSRGAASQNIEIELLIADFPTRPTAADRFSNIPGFAGDIFQPAGVLVADSGFWRLEMKKVNP